MKLAINGRFLGARPTGVQRVAGQLVDALADLEDVTLHVPRGVPVPPSLNARVRAITGLLPGIPWEQLELPARGLLGRTDLSLDPANAGPAWGGPRVLVLHDVLPITDPRWFTPAFRRWFRFRVVPAARRAARVIMFSEWARREAVRAAGLTAERVVVVPQGAGPFDAPAPADHVERTLDRLKLRPGFVLAAGDGDPRKNAGFLLDVLRGLHRRGGPVPTLVLTGAPYGHIQARPAPLDDRLPVRRLGFVSDDTLWALYTAADVFCFPSLGEGFGRPPLEAMACGTPAMVAEYGPAREVLGDAAAILALEPEAWADAIAGLLDDEAERRRRAEAGREHAARFRWDAAARAVLAACRSALEDGEPPTGPGAGGGV